MAATGPQDLGPIRGHDAPSGNATGMLPSSQAAPSPFATATSAESMRFSKMPSGGPSSNHPAASKTVSTSSHGWDDDTQGPRAGLQPSTTDASRRQSSQMGPTETAAPGSQEDAWGDEAGHKQVAPPLCPPPVELPPGLSWEAAAHWGTSTPGSPSPSRALSAHSDDFFNASEGQGGDGSATGLVASAQKAPQGPTEAPQPISTAKGREHQGAAPSFAALEAQHSIAAEPNGWSESEGESPEDLQQLSDGGPQNADVDTLVSNVQRELAQQKLSDPGNMQMTDSGMSVPQRVVSASESDSEGPPSVMPDGPSGLTASAENQPSHVAHRGASDQSENGLWGGSAAAQDKLEGPSRFPADVDASRAAEVDAQMRPAVTAEGRSLFNEQNQKGGSDDEEDAAWSEDTSEEGSMSDEPTRAMQADRVSCAASLTDQDITIACPTKCNIGRRFSLLMHCLSHFKMLVISFFRYLQRI